MKKIFLIIYFIFTLLFTSACNFNSTQQNIINSEIKYDELNTSYSTIINTSNVSIERIDTEKISEVTDSYIKQKWEMEYINYLDNIDLNSLSGVYIKDINKDCIPEVILNGWHNKYEILYFSNNELKIMEFWNTYYIYYLVDSSQLLVRSWDSYPLGSWDSYTLYNLIDNEFNVSLNIISSIKSDFNSDDINNKYLINDIEVTKSELNDSWNNMKELELNAELLSLNYEDIGDFNNYLTENLFND